METISQAIEQAASLIRGAKRLTAFTGAGISVESGIPPFRGEAGIWTRYDPEVLDIAYFNANPGRCWPTIKEIFYDYFGKAEPNPAHLILARMEASGRLESVITQNIDNLHHRAGSRNVIEYHGNSRLLACLACGRKYDATTVDLRKLPPACDCGAVLKPDFVFFGEGIPPSAASAAERAALRADVMLVIGTTGEVYPAALLPLEASRRGATIIEINPEKSGYSDTVTDLFIRSRAVESLEAIAKLL